MTVFEKYRQLLNYYLKDYAIPVLEENWNHHTRFYHNVEHLEKAVAYIENNGRHVATPEFDALILAAFFHDSKYDVRNPHLHEAQSMEFFNDAFDFDDVGMKAKVNELIECTKHRKVPTDELCKIMWWADNDEFRAGFNTLLTNEKKIRKEFKHIPNYKYRPGKISFLKSNLGLFSASVDKDIKQLMDWVETNYK